MEITGMLAIGNGESCPFCNQIMTTETNTLSHLLNNHPDETFAGLHPEDKGEKQMKKTDPNKYKTQHEKVLYDLLEGRTITPLDALNKYGCFRLAAVIFDLKAEGHDITTTMVSNGKKKFAEYKLFNGELF